MDKNSTAYQVEKSQAIKSNTASYDENYILGNNGILNIYGNLKAHELAKAISEKSNLGINLIQFARKFTVDPQTLILLNNEVLKLFRNCSLRASFNGHGAFEDLNFLEHLQNLKSLSISTFGEMDLDPISKYLELESLGIGGNRLRIEKITKQQSIKKLFVFEKIKDVESIGKMTWLEELTFSKMTIKELDFLLPLKNLRALHFILGSSNNFKRIGEIGKIEKLSFTLVRQLKIEHLESINLMKYLNELKFDTQTHLLNLDWFKLKKVKVEVVNCKNYNQ